MNSVDSFIGRRIRQFRWMYGVSQADLARHLSVDPAQINAYECGAERVAAAELIQMAGLLDVPVAALFEGIGATAGAAHDADQSTEPGTDQAHILPQFNLLADHQQMAVLKVAQKMAEHLEQIAPPPQDATALWSAPDRERQG